MTPHRGQPAMIHFPHPDLIEVIQPGARLVIGDGEVEFTVAEKKARHLALCYNSRRFIRDQEKGLMHRALTSLSRVLPQKIVLT